INELGLISGRKTLESVETRGTSSDRAYIGREAALAKAFEHAGISSAEAVNVEIEMDIENGVMVYDIEFTAGGTEYDYEIDAVTGEVIKAENEPADTQAETPKPTAAPDDSASAQHIGRKAALRAALAHAGVSESDAYDVDIESDKENGRSVYDVEFKAGGNEYDYVIDAVTGEVLRYETESASGSVPTAKPSSKPNSSSYIGRDAALDKALAHAGLSLSAVSDIEIELEKDDGSAYYDVEFRSGSKEYEYRINAVSGKVISNSSEHAGDHHDHSASLSLIGEDRAWEIALRKAGLSMNKISGKDIELDHENGVYIYELEFRCEGFEYEVKINAATGVVMRFEKELDD
ncbi:MAG: PepSY domain-containing protein, partial [Clostridia bacterium]|nr:PepSY domain-containing protein [Clostridia bacterium]